MTTSTAPDKRRHCPRRGTKGAAMERTTRSVGSILLRFKQAENRERQKRTAATAAGSVPPPSLPPAPAALPWMDAVDADSSGQRKWLADNNGKERKR